MSQLNKILLKASSYQDTQQNIVQSDLVLWVDTTNSSSYSGTGTVWNDLSGKSNNLNLYNCSYNSINKAIYFNGSSSYAISASSLINYFNPVNFSQTIEIWFLKFKNSGILVDELGTSSLSSYWHTSNLELVNGSLGGRYWYQNGLFAPQNLSSNYEWTHASIRYNRSTQITDLFLNGFLVASGSNGFNRSNPNPYYYIALGVYDTTNIGSGAFYNGYISIFRTYSRALSNNEILNNYNIDKIKFPSITYIKLLIVGAESINLGNDIKEKIIFGFNKNWPNYRPIITTNYSNPSNYSGSDITISNYDVVFIWTNSIFNNSALGTNLNSYVQSGGNLIICAFALSNLNGLLITNFNYNNCPVILSNYTFYLPGGTTGLGTYDSNDIIMKNVTTFNPGSGLFGHPNVQLQSESVIVAQYNNSQICVAKKIIGTSKTVFLNFHPASSAVWSGWNITSHGDILMANSIVWASGK